MAFQKPNPKVIVAKFAVVLLGLGLLWLIRPIIHPLVYGMMYQPGLFFAVGLPFVLGIVLFLAPPLGRDSLENKGTILLGGFIVLMLAGLVVGTAGSVLTDLYLADNLMDDTEEVDDLPPVSSDNLRMVPKEVADVQTSASVSYRTHQLGTSDISRKPSGELAWSYSIEPQGLNNRLSENQRGHVFTTMNRMENREIDAFDNHSFSIGNGMFLQRSSLWNLRKSDFHSRYVDDSIEIIHDGEAYLAFPKTGHEWKWAGVIPYSVPVWDGVALIHEDGTIEHLSPEEARDHEALEGQRLYPFHNTKLEMNSISVRNGWVNTLPLIGKHINEVHMADLPAGAGNEQPFLIEFEEKGISYITAMEPYGESTTGLDEVWYVDGRTGEYEYMGTGEDNTLMGPKRAMGLVEAEDSRTSWNRFSVVEPVPVVVNGNLWWHSKVVPSDYTDVSRSVLVRAESSSDKDEKDVPDVIEMETTEELVQFVESGSLEEINVDEDEVEVGTEPPEEGEEGEVAYYVVIKDSEGNELQKIPIEPGQEISVTPSE